MLAKLLILCLVLVACFTAPAAADPALPLQAGAAFADITPPVPYRMCGYFNERLSTGVLNPLCAKALVLRQGREKLAIVTCDLIGLNRAVTDQARKLAAGATGIRPENIQISATHTHTGPLYDGSLRDFFHQQAVDKLGQDPYEKEPYTPILVKGIVQAIVKADACLAPARLEAGAAQQQGLSFNRRFHMKDGTVVFNPGVLNPNIVRPAGPIDPQVPIAMVRQADGGKAIAGIVNFAMHLDTLGGTKYAADYPFFLQQALGRSQGEDLLVLFATGTCGDINHIDVTTKERHTTQQIGETLAKTVQARLGELKPVQADLAGLSRRVDLPIPQFTPEQLDQARRDMRLVGTKDLSFLGQVEACKRLNVAARGGATTRQEVQVFRLGKDLAVVGLPGEIFVELGLAIKKASPFATTIVIELAQDCPAYVPTRKAFTEGSYETVNSEISPGGGELLAETACQLLKELGAEK